MTAFTMEKLQAAIDSLGPPPPNQTFCSSRMFPSERAMMFRGAGSEEIVIAHPDFWRAAVEISSTPEPWPTFGLHGIEVIDIDANEKERIRVFTSIADAIEVSERDKRLIDRYFPALTDRRK